MAHPDPQETETNEQYSQSRVYQWFDSRLDLNDELLGKAFPEDRYSSFLLGEVSLFCFVILAVTGTVLGLLYVPAAQNVTYIGQVSEYAGTTVPQAFSSVLHITYDVRLGMYVRMLHHWASYVFVAAIGIHAMRIFFSGAYRNPREINWVIGTTLLAVAMIEGFLGYALPYDNFSQTATGIGFQLTQSIPFLGTWITNLVFGGNWPSNASIIIPRMFFYHVFLLPAVIAGLIAAHLGILIRQKHTEQQGTRKDLPDSENTPDYDDESVVVGIPLVPNQMAVTLIVGLFTVGVISFLAGLFPIQRIAISGPASPFETPLQPAPAWFFMWTYGALKLALSVLGKYGTFVFGVIVPGLVVGAMFLWPFVDRSDEPRHFTANPLDRPLPTAVGIASIAFVLMLSIAGMNEIVAESIGIAATNLKRPLQILSVAVPVVEGLIVYFMLRRRVRRKESERMANRSELASTGRTTDDD